LETALLVEQEIIAQIAATGIRLRFDKVALRLVNGLRAVLPDMVPDGQALIFTVTAPIRHPAKTSAALENLVRNGLPGHDFCGDIHDNHVRILQVKRVRVRMPRVFGFVHNSASNAGTILALTVSRLRLRNSA
jgi:hypothetical protein